ncbi:MAG: hypothetical protein V4736_15290, partial [Bdellovibrionota bacterium]
MHKFKKIIQTLSWLSLLTLSGCQISTVERGTAQHPRLLTDRQDLTYLENKLHTQKEKDQYSRNLSWFEDDDERREF